MFDSIKLHTSETLDIEDLLHKLVDFGYHGCKRVMEEGDFARLGDTATIYPITFEYPVRIEFNGDLIERIRSVDPITYDVIEEHKCGCLKSISIQLWLLSS